jgi:hypothetical protein
MANSPAYGVEILSLRLARMRIFLKITLIAALLLLCLAPRAGGQSSPKVTGVAPATGKVNDDVTLTGENLGKDSISAVYLSDDKDDYKATLVEQGNAKIVLKVPQVKSGGYNISIQEGDKILILPLRFTVQS